MNLRRRRRDRVFSAVVRFSLAVPLVLLVFMVLVIVDWSMGTAVRIDGGVPHQWTLTQSLFRAKEIRREAAVMDSEAVVFFRFGLTPSFLFSPPSHLSGSTGLLVALMGSFQIVVLGLCLAFPPALVTALWLNHDKRLAAGTPPAARILRFIMNLFVRIPLVLYGVFFLSLISRADFRYGGLGIRNIGNAVLLMALIALPRLVVMMEKEIADIPLGIRTASYALGAPWAAVVFRQVLPSCFFFMAAGTLRISARMLGVASPFIVLGVPSFLTSPPLGPGDQFTNLPVQIFQWALRPDGIYRNLAASAALVLLALIFAIEIIADLWRRRLVRRREGLR